MNAPEFVSFPIGQALSAIRSGGALSGTKEVSFLRATSRVSALPLNDILRNRSVSAQRLVLRRFADSLISDSSSC